MECMSAYCVLAVVHHAPAIGGTRSLILDQPLCSMPIGNSFILIVLVNLCFFLEMNGKQGLLRGIKKLLVEVVAFKGVFI